MKNGDLDQFLEAGWYTEAVLYYDHHVYWCEGTTDFSTGITTFFVDCWKAECDGELYHQYLTDTGEIVDYQRVIEITGKDHNAIKQQFLAAPVFGGKSFWQIEKELVWVEEGDPIRLN